MVTQLFTFLEKFYPLSQEVKDAIAGRMKKKHFLKHEILIEYGKPNKDLFFLEKGLVRCFYYARGKEITDWFLPENELIALGESYYKKIPSRHGIEALEDCETLWLTYDDMEEMYDQFHMLERNSRYITMEYGFNWCDRYRATKNIPVKDRYMQMLSRMPHVLSRVELYYVASYLGTTDSHLSRIRSKITS